MISNNSTGVLQRKAIHVPAQDWPGRGGWAAGRLGVRCKCELSPATAIDGSKGWPARPAAASAGFLKRHGNPAAEGTVAEGSQIAHLKRGVLKNWEDSHEGFQVS